MALLEIIFDANLLKIRRLISKILFGILGFDKMAASSKWPIFNNTK
jgi:hypothetical protein